MTTVSVIIPCYNCGSYLNETIASVTNQIYSDWEIIIVDDGSTDAATLQALKNIEDRTDMPVTVLHQENSGPASARNRGIAKARGTYILPLDADDTIEPEYMALAIPLIEQDPNLGIVYCKARKFGKETGPWELPDFAIEHMAIDNIIFCTAFFRKADWETTGGYLESLRHGMEDYAFWLRILRLGRTVHRIDKELFNYRISESSRTTRFQDNQQQIITTYAEIFRDNVDFFAAHAEALYRYRFSIESTSRALQRMLKPISILYKPARRVYRLIKYRDRQPHRFVGLASRVLQPFPFLHAPLRRLYHRIGKKQSSGR